MLFDHAALRALFFLKTSSMYPCAVESLRIAKLSLSLNVAGRDMPFGHAALRALFFLRHLLCYLV